MIALKDIQKELMEKKWKSISKHPKFDSITEFDIIDEKKSWYLADWFLFIKEVPNLDDATADQIAQSLNSLEEEERSWWKARILFFVVLADQVNAATANRIASNEFDIRSINKKGQVSGRILVIDLANDLVYGSLPRSPLDARLKLIHIKDTLEKVLNKPLHYVPSDKPRKASSFWVKFFMIVIASILLGIISALVFLYSLLHK
jgi:hypothetical protein